MGNYAWEGGSIKLPPAEYKRVRNIMRRYIESDLDEAFRLSQLFWQTCPRWAKKNPLNAGYAFIHGENDWGKRTPIPTDWADPRWRRENGLDPSRWTDSPDMAHHLSEYLVRYEYKPGVGSTYHRQRKSDMPKLTGATWRLEFSEITIAFTEGNTLEYHSGHNKSQPERARRHPWVMKMFQTLDGVAWTSRSGGLIVGNDEYNQDAGLSVPGAGGNYITAVYGGIGERQYKQHHGFEYKKLHQGRAVRAYSW